MDPGLTRLYKIPRAAAGRRQKNEDVGSLRESRDAAPDSSSGGLEAHQAGRHQGETGNRRASQLPPSFRKVAWRRRIVEVFLFSFGSLVVLIHSIVSKNFVRGWTISSALSAFCFVEVSHQYA
jgi:surface antigen